MIEDRDPGDEHVDAPPTPRDPVLALLDEWAAEGDPIPEYDRDVYDFIDLAESMRMCCRACTLEANGEDGS